MRIAIACSLLPLLMLPLLVFPHPPPQEKPTDGVRELCQRWNELQVRIRDGTVPKEQARQELMALHERWMAVPRRTEPAKAAPFPVEGFTCRDIGGRSGSGYVPWGYDFFQGNGHHGHPAVDIFIGDLNRDGQSDANGKPVRVLSFSAGWVVVRNTGWQPGSDIRGGNYVGVFDPSRDEFFYYAHLGDVLVSLGDWVKPGQPLGTVGRTGKAAFARRSPTHLHFVILSYGGGRMTPVNPYPRLCPAPKHARAPAPPAMPEATSTPSGEALALRIPPPEGFWRRPAPSGTFADYLRQLTLKPGHPPVRLHDGRLKARQDVHAAVLDLDIGRRNLQQCADAIIRLRADYLFASGQEERIRFHFVSGFEAAWVRWREGWRPQVKGQRVTEAKSARPSSSPAEFRRYLEKLFEFANTWSLARDTDPVAVAEMAVGDLFVQGGFPGHAVLVADMAENGSGKKVFLLLQGYMPAQEIHVLKNPQDGTPWYPLDFGSTLVTPEWTFRAGDLRRFR